MRVNFLKQTICNQRCFCYVAQFLNAESDTSQQVSGDFWCNYVSVLASAELHFYTKM